MFGQQQQQQQAKSVEGDEAVKMVKVKEAWAEVPEKEQVVLRRSRREKDEKNMNLINNNNGNQQQQQQQVAAKRRSYHPQDYLSQVLVEDEGEVAEGRQRRRRARKPADFPKVPSLKK